MEWEETQDSLQADDEVYNILQSGLDKLAIYYRKMEASDAYGNAMSMSILLFFILIITLLRNSVLTPYIKMDYLNLWWNEKVPSDPTKTLAEQAQDQFLNTVCSFMLSD